MFLLNVTALFVRLFGIYLLYNTLWQLRSVFSLPEGAGDWADQYSLVVTAGSVSVLIIALVMIVLPVTVAKWLLPNTGTQSASLEDGAKALEVCAYTVLGIYILSWAVPDLIMNAGMFLVAERNPGVYGLRELIEIKASFGITVVEIGIGAYLALGAIKVSELLRRLRGI